MPITLKNDGDLEAQGIPPAPTADVKQRRRMLLALAVLLAAVLIVFIKDRQIFSSPNPGPENNNQTATPPAPGPPPSLPATATVAPAAPPPAAKKRSSPRVAPTADNASPGPVITATDRAVLPPLEVEVVAGNQRQPMATSNSSVKVEMQPSVTAASGPAIAPAPASDDNADAHVNLSPSTSARITRSVQPNYPLLAKQMKVQGAVVLQALIDKTGSIEDLHVVSGPTILAAAAREAVKQWHFKPYYQQGQAVETEARITVNFTISTY